MTIYVTDDAFSVKAKRFNKMFTSILALFFLLKKKKNIFTSFTAINEKSPIVRIIFKDSKFF